MSRRARRSRGRRSSPLTKLRRTRGVALTAGSWVACGSGVGTLTTSRCCFDRPTANSQRNPLSSRPCSSRISSSWDLPTVDPRATIGAVTTRKPATSASARSSVDRRRRARRRVQGDHRAAAGGRPAALRHDRQGASGCPRPPSASGCSACSTPASCRSSRSPTRSRWASAARP